MQVKLKMQGQKLLQLGICYKLDCCFVFCYILRFVHVFQTFSQ